MSNENNIETYMKAIREENIKPLFDLAFQAGYTRKFEDHLCLEKARQLLMQKIESLSERSNLLELLKETDSYCNKVFPGIPAGTVLQEYYTGKPRQLFNIPSDKEINKMKTQDIYKVALGYIEKATMGSYWANKEAHFILTREGPSPHSNSFVAYISWVSVDKTGKKKCIEPGNRRFFIDVYKENPLWEMRLDLGVYSSIHNERADTLAKGKSVKPYIYGEWDGTGPHTVQFSTEQKEEAREYADSLAISWETENLIYGKRAIQNLISLKEGRTSTLFPLSIEGYQRLIDFQKKEIEDLKESLKISSKEIKGIKEGIAPIIKELYKQEKEYMQALLDIDQESPLYLEKLHEKMRRNFEERKPNRKDLNDLKYIENYQAKIAKLDDIFKCSLYFKWRERLMRLNEYIEIEKNKESLSRLEKALKTVRQNRG